MPCARRQGLPAASSQFFMNKLSLLKSQVLSSADDTSATTGIQAMRLLDVPTFSNIGQARTEFAGQLLPILIVTCFLAYLALPTIASMLKIAQPGHLSAH